MMRVALIATFEAVLPKRLIALMTLVLPVAPSMTITRLLPTNDPATGSREPLIAVFAILPLS